MEFREVVRRRRMVRGAATRPIPPDRLARVLDAARRGPSAGFSQAQSFVVVTDPALRAALAAQAGEPAYLVEGHPAWLSAAPALVVVCTSEEPYERRYAEPDKGAVGDPAGWPVPYRYVDAGCALMLLLLAAVDEGLAAGFLGVHRVPGIRDLLGIPPEVEPIGIVTLGYPAPDRPSPSLLRGRRAAAEVVHHDRWGAPGGGPQSAPGTGNRSPGANS